MSWTTQETVLHAQISLTHIFFQTASAFSFFCFNQFQKNFSVLKKKRNATMLQTYRLASVEWKFNAAKLFEFSRRENLYLKEWLCTIKPYNFLFCLAIYFASPVLSLTCKTHSNPRKIALNKPYWFMGKPVKSSTVKEIWTQYFCPLSFWSQMAYCFKSGWLTMVHLI